MHNIIFFFWYKIPRLILILFLPLSFIFYIIIYLRRFLLLYFFKRFTSKARVIIVGNLVVGGSGKTPFTIWLSKYLESKDKKTTIISSGYGSTITSPVIIDSLSNPNEVGDEAVLLSNKTQSTIVSSSNRIESTKFCDTCEADFIIHDDGLQHYSLNRQYEFIIENTNKRDNNLICVVENPTDVIAIESSGCFKGKYFVLMGRLSPIDGVTPDNLGIPSLVNRIMESEIKEVIIATSPTVEGDATSFYIKDQINDETILISRIAYGVPMGGELEYVDNTTLSRAIQGRRKLD